MFVELASEIVLEAIAPLFTGHFSVENERVGGSGFGLKAIQSKNAILNTRLVTAPCNDLNLI